MSSMKRKKSSLALMMAVLMIIYMLPLNLQVVQAATPSWYDIPYGDICTIAGTGTAGYSGDGGASTLAQVNKPRGIAVDKAGNIYFADGNNHRIRKIDTSGNISTVAGTGVKGYSGDGGAASAAQLNLPYDVAVDSAGNLVISDFSNFRIRVVAAADHTQFGIEMKAGFIYTVGGTGTSGYKDGALGTSQINGALGLAFDSAGNIYIANNYRVRKINASTGEMTTVAGTGGGGYSGDGGPATSAALNSTDVVLDSANNLYIADSQNSRIRRVDAGTGIITTVAGNGNTGISHGDGGPAIEASFSPISIAIDSANNLYIANNTYNILRKIDAGPDKVIDSTDIISTVAGTGVTGTNASGPAASTPVSPFGVALDSAGRIYISDNKNSYIRFVNSAVNTASSNEATVTSDTYTVSTGGTAAETIANVPYNTSKEAFLAGLTKGESHQTWDTANVHDPVVTGDTLVVTAQDGTTNVTYTISVNGASSNVATIKSGTYAVSTGGTATETIANVPYNTSKEAFLAALTKGESNQTWDTANVHDPVVTGDTLVVTAQDGTTKVTYTISVNAAPSTAATVTSDKYTISAGGTAAETIANVPYNTSKAAFLAGLTKEESHQTWDAASVHDPVVTGDTLVVTAQDGTTKVTYTINVNAAQTARPWWYDTPIGNMTKIAGTYESAYSGDGGPATDASLSGADRLVVDGARNIYIADGANHRIRKINTDGIISTVAGNGTNGNSGDGGPATAAQLGDPWDVVLDSAGNLYISDYWNNNVREIAAADHKQFGIDMKAGCIYTVVGAGTNHTDDGQSAVTAGLYQPKGLAIDSANNLYIVDNNRIRKVDASTGMITTVAGGPNVSLGDNGPANAAQLTQPADVAIDSENNLYIAESGRIRKVEAGTDKVIDGTDIITTVAGNGTGDYSGDNGPVAGAMVSPNSIAFDSENNLYVACGYRIRKIDAGTGIISTVAGTGETKNDRFTNGPATSIPVSPYGVAVDSAGGIYFGTGEIIRFVNPLSSTPHISWLSISGSPELVYSGTDVTYDLGKLAISAQDMLGSTFDLTGKTVAWTAKGPATVSGSTLTITGSGSVSVTAAVDWVTSNALAVTAVQTAPVIAPDSTANYADQAINLTFTDNSNWREGITGITVDGKALISGGLSFDKYTVSQGTISFPAGVLSTAGDHTIVIRSTGYNDVSLTQKILAIQTPPVLSADSSQNYKGVPVEITFTDDPAWRAAISSISLDGATLATGKYTISEGKISISADLVTATGNHTIVIKAPTYTDNAVTQSIIELVPPVLSADSSNNVMGQAMDLAFTDDAAWRGAITKITVDVKTLTAGQYTLTEGNIKLAANAFTTIGSSTITVSALGYPDVIVVQNVNEQNAAQAASFAGDHIVTEKEINGSGLKMVIAPAQGYHFNTNTTITADIKNAIINSMVFDYAYGMVDQNAGAAAKEEAAKTNLSKINTIQSRYFAKTRLSETGFDADTIARIRAYDATLADGYKVLSIHNEQVITYNEIGDPIITYVDVEYLNDCGRFLALGWAIQNELKANGAVTFDANGNLVISCSNSGYLRKFANVIRLVDGGQSIVFGDLPVSLTVPAELVTEGAPLKTANTFDILEIKAHVEVWEFVDPAQGYDEAIGAKYGAGNGSNKAYKPEYTLQQYIKRVPGDVLTEEDIRNGGTLGPNGTGKKLIKIVVDGRTGPTWWAYIKSDDKRFIYNAFRTNTTVDNYSLASEAQTPQDDAQWLKIENELLTGGATSGGQYGFSTDNMYVFNSSGDWRRDEYDVHNMWYTYQIPKIADYDITEDQTVYVNQIYGMTGGSGQGGTQGSPFWGMDGRCSFTIKAVDAASSTVATVTSDTYTISVGGTAAETITNVPYNTSKEAFLAGLTKGESHQTWDTSNVHDPIVTGDTLAVTAQDGTTKETYTVTVNPGTDTAVPTWTNGSLAASNISQTGLALTWHGAQDDTGVTGYKIYQNGTVIGTVTASTYAVSGLLPDTAYSFKVEALDLAGKESVNGPSVTATTLAVPVTGAPALVSAVTDSLGKKITLTFNKDMADPAGKQAEFTVNVGTIAQTVTNVVLGSDHKQIVLSMGNKLSGAITVSYLKGSMVSADGSALESFYGQAVTNNILASLANMADFDEPATQISYDTTTDPSNPVLLYRYDNPVDYDNVQLTWYFGNGFFNYMIDDLNNYVKIYEADTGASVTLPNKMTRENSPDTYTTGETKNHQIVTDWHFWQIQGRAPLGLKLVSRALKPSTTYILEIDKGFVFNNGTSTSRTYKFEFTTTSTSQGKPHWADGSSLTVRATTPNSVTLQWPLASDNHGAAYEDGYSGQYIPNLHYNIYQDGILIGTVDEKTTTYTVNNLTTGPAYQFKVEAADYAGNVSQSCLTAGTDTAVPAWTNGSLTASNISQTGLTLTWHGAQDDTGVNGYKIYQNGTVIDTVTVSTYAVSGLLPDTSYSFKVEALDLAGNESVNGPSVTATTLTVPVAGAPATASAANNSVSASPTTVTAGSSTTLTATGDRQTASGAVTGDERYVPKSWTSTETGQSGTFGLSGGSYISDYTTVTAGTYTVTATFQKQTWNGAAWTDVSGSTDTKTISVTVTANAAATYAIAPIADRTLTALVQGYASGSQETKVINVTNTGTGNLTNLSASLSGSDANDFRITQPASSLNSGASTSFTVKAKDGLAAGTYTANVTVSADNMTDVAFTVTQSVNLPNAPANPQNLVAIGGDRQVTLNWSTVTGATYYSIYMATEPGQFSSPSVTTVTYATYNVHNLTNGKTYYFVVKAGNLGGISAESNQASAIPATVPAAPTNVTAVAGNGQATITFTAPTENGGSAITGYEVTASPGNVVQTGAASPITITGLTNGTSYTFTVKAINGSGRSAASGASNAVTPKSSSSRSNGSSGNSNTIPEPIAPAKPESSDTGVNVLVNGKSENVGTATTSGRNDQTVLTIAVDQKQLEDKLAAEGQHAVVTIPVTTKSDVVAGELNGQMVKSMEDKQAVLEIKTDRATYTLPAEQINIDTISNQMGKSVALQDIKVHIEIAAPTANSVKVVENAATKGSFTLVVSPIDFTVSATNGSTTVEVSKFNAYVERTVAIPDGVDPNKITTGIVVHPDGTVRHVPTKVVVIDGKYYAKINSLTNSTYTVVWHPLEFSDVANHWAKDAVNDMGSRMVINGTGNDLFNPDKDITRAEFAAIIVRGLGLKLENGTSTFSDVKPADWYNSAINTASAYHLINGFEDGTFRPNDKITREQAMVIIAKAMEITNLKGKHPVQSADETLRPYADAAEASAWAKSGIAESVQAGIVSGRSNTKLAPKDSITRAEVAAIVRRLMQKSELI